MRFVILPILLSALSCSKDPGAEFRRLQVVTPTSARLIGKPCEIHRDAKGLFHARAADELTTYACLGYLHGRYRGFQADYLRRAALGRLSEILGFSSYKQDYFLRVLGLGELAERVLAALPPGPLGIVEAYTHGMNRGLAYALMDGAYEFKKLGYAPEPWHARDTAAVLLLQSFNETQHSIWQRTRESGRLAQFGEAAKTLFAREGLPWDTSILKPGEYPTDNAKPVDDKTIPAPEVHAPTEKAGTGSNSWVLSPKRSASGKAWLANDPHLELKHPPFWFPVHLTGGEIDAFGLGVPGTPIEVSGFNHHVAWGLTDSYLDAGDLVAVKKTEAAAFSSFRPTIRVKVGPFHLPIPGFAIQRSPEGFPVLPIDAPKDHVLVMRWTGYLVNGDSFAGFEHLIKAKNVRDIDRVFARLRVPSWNFVFADVTGTIGYRAEGAALRRKGPAAYGIVDKSANQLKLTDADLLNQEQMPHLLDPARGWIVTGNNRQWPADAQFDGGRAYPQGFRAFRIEELLQAKPRHDLDSISATQCDTQAPDARFLVPRLLKVADAASRWGGPHEKEALDELRRWNFVMSGECRACSIYARWIDRTRESTGLDIAALYRVLDNSSSKYHEAIRNELSQALVDLRIGPAKTFPPWVELQRAYFPHISKAGLFAVSAFLSTPGNEFSVSPAKSDWKGDHYEQRLGASVRLIVELTNPPRGRFALPGPSDDTEGKDLNDPNGPWARWRDCRYDTVDFPLAWDKITPERINL